MRVVGICSYTVRNKQNKWWCGMNETHKCYMRLWAGYTMLWAGYTMLWTGYTMLWAGYTMLWAGYTRLWAGYTRLWAGVTRLWAGVTRLWAGVTQLYNCGWAECEWWTTVFLCLRARVKLHVEVQPNHRLPHFAAKRAPLELVQLDGLLRSRVLAYVARLAQIPPAELPKGVNTLRTLTLRSRVPRLPRERRTCRARELSSYRSTFKKRENATRINNALFPFFFFFFFF